MRLWLYTNASRKDAATLFSTHKTILPINMGNSDASKQRSCCKSVKASRSRLPFYAGHLVLLAIVTLPTIFYVFQPVHLAHPSVSNKTTSTEPQDHMNASETTTTNLSTHNGFPPRCNSPLVPDYQTGQCRPPCSWTTQTTRTQQVYYVVVALGLWMAFISTIVTVITWANIASLRKFPHVVRFHIIVCCVFLAFAKMVPLRNGLEKTFCSTEFWELTGQSSFTAVLQGAASHYFCLAHSFWAMCFVANTYAVIVQSKRAVFRHPIRHHLMQSLFCWLAPAIIVGCCLFFAPPGYIFLYVDLLGAGLGSMQMAYYASTLPMQVTLGISLCLLWSIVWHLRKARLDATKRVIRAREERVTMRRVERQFMSMAILMLLIVGVVLTIRTIIMYRVRNNIHDALMYFACLQKSKDCKAPNINSVLPLINLVAPGFLCLVFFFLLLMNKDCRQIWKGCFGKCSAVFAKLCLPVRKLRAETDRSRCSSTLTVLSDRRGSEVNAFNVSDPLSRKRASSIFPIAGTRVAMLRASSLSGLPVETRQLNVGAHTRFHTPCRDLDVVKSRCNSVPIFLPTVEQERNILASSQTLLAKDNTASEVKISDSAIDLEGTPTGSFMQDIEEYSSRL